MDMSVILETVVKDILQFRIWKENAIKILIRFDFMKGKKMLSILNIYEKGNLSCFKYRNIFLNPVCHNCPHHEFSGLGIILQHFYSGEEWIWFLKGRDNNIKSKVLCTSHFFP